MVEYKHNFQHGLSFKTVLMPLYLLTVLLILLKSCQDRNKKQDHIYSGTKHIWIETLPEWADLWDIANNSFFQQRWQQYRHSSLGCRARRLTHTSAHLCRERVSEGRTYIFSHTNTNIYCTHGPVLWWIALPYWVFSVLGLQPSSQTPERHKMTVRITKSWKNVYILCCNVT